MLRRLNEAGLTCPPGKSGGFFVYSFGKCASRIQQPEGCLLIESGEIPSQSPAKLHCNLEEKNILFMASQTPLLKPSSTPQHAGNPTFNQERFPTAKTVKQTRRHVRRLKQNLRLQTAPNVRIMKPIRQKIEEKQTT